MNPPNAAYLAKIEALERENAEMAEALESIRFILPSDGEILDGASLNEGRADILGSAAMHINSILNRRKARKS